MWPIFFCCLSPLQDPKSFDGRDGLSLKPLRISERLKNQGAPGVSEGKTMVLARNVHEFRRAVREEYRGMEQHRVYPWEMEGGGGC